MTGRDSPLDDLEDLFDRMARQVEEMPGFEAGGPGAVDVDVDVADRGDEVVVTADLPGFDADGIDISVSDRTLTISAERAVGADDEGATYVRQERRGESVSRSLRLPRDVDEAGASATHRNGVLTVTLPARSGGDAHSIDIE